MTHKERFLATIERKPVDYPASWLGMPVPSAEPSLFSYFHVHSINELKRFLNDDIYPVEVPYHSADSNAIYAAFPFSKQSAASSDERTLTAPGYFEDMTDPREVDSFDWPVPEECIDPALCRKAVESIPDDYAKIGILWSAHFQDVCSAFGMETALVNMITEPEIFEAVYDRIVDFYLRANRIFYEATKGKLDGILIGNDLGSQRGLMISRDMVKKYVIPPTQKIIAQAKSYGLKVIHHSCGAVYDIIPDLIGAGADVIHPIQALAAGMQPERLQQEFASQVGFCGGVDAQELLVHGTPAQVYDNVLYLKKLFPTGLVLSPSHEAVLPDIPPANLEALFAAVKFK